MEGLSIEAEAIALPEKVASLAFYRFIKQIIETITRVKFGFPIDKNQAEVIISLNNNMMKWDKPCC